MRKGKWGACGMAGHAACEGWVYVQARMGAPGCAMAARHWESGWSQQARVGEASRGASRDRPSGAGNRRVDRRVHGLGRGAGTPLGARDDEGWGKAGRGSRKENERAIGLWRRRRTAWTRRAPASPAAREKQVGRRSELGIVWTPCSVGDRRRHAPRCLPQRAGLEIQRSTPAQFL